MIATPTPTSKPAGAVTPTPAKLTGVDTPIPNIPEQQQFKTECKPGKCTLEHRFAKTYSDSTVHICHFIWSGVPLSSSVDSAGQLYQYVR